MGIHDQPFGADCPEKALLFVFDEKFKLPSLSKTTVYLSQEL